MLTISVIFLISFFFAITIYCYRFRKACITFVRGEGNETHKVRSIAWSFPIFDIISRVSKLEVSIISQINNISDYMGCNRIHISNDTRSSCTDTMIDTHMYLSTRLSMKFNPFFNYKPFNVRFYNTVFI